jgi:hypothetical protein
MYSELTNFDRSNHLDLHFDSPVFQGTVAVTHMMNFEPTFDCYPEIEL